MPDGKTFGLSTIGQIAVHVEDLDRAVVFYRERLGMRFLFQEPRMIAKMGTYDLWMAFFRDSEGNMHGLMREVPQ